MNINNFIISKKISSRYLVHQILDGVFVNKRTKPQTIEYLERKKISFEEKNIAQADRISNFIFGHLKSIDDLIYKMLKKQPNISVTNIFRILVSELKLKEAPNYALVNSAVDLAKTNIKTKSFQGLINAVSRKLVKKFNDTDIIFTSNLESNFKDYLVKNYSEKIANDIEKTYVLHNSIDITLKNFDEVNYWEKEFEATLLPTGSLRIKKNIKISSLKGYKEGKWWVQDISSSIPVKLLGEIKDKEVLDLFSAPGGKAMQLSALGANVTCLDQSPTRLKTLKDNLARTNMQSKVILTDFYKFKTRKKFDIVVIDVPCSATGTIRKNKEIQYLNPYKRLKNLLKIQKDSLKISKKFVKDDGKILYCNCSLFYSEGEDQISKFLEKNHDWNLENLTKKDIIINKGWLDNLGFLRLRPDHLMDLGGMDGFFAAILKKV